jgi:hypothetical protein
LPVVRVEAHKSAKKGDAAVADHEHEDGADAPGVNRRSFLGRVVGGAALIGAGTMLGTTPANAQAATDQDPVDSANCGRGRPNHRRSGLNDSDPVDQAGWGRGGVPTCGRRRSGVTDADPRDGANMGRGRPNRRRTGLNDSDPVDNAGWGRGGG